MVTDDLIGRLPYPVASVYATLDAPQAGSSARREALYFTVYQVLRTVGLTLMGQYFTQDLPRDTPAKTIRKFNETILRVRFPHFSDWISLLQAMENDGRALGLDFLPDFPDAWRKAAGPRGPGVPTVRVPPHYDLEKAADPGRTLLEAFLGLRNGCAHAGVSSGAECESAVKTYRPWLEELLLMFGFLADYDLLVLRSPLDPAGATALVQTLRGPEPAAPEETPLDEALEEAFEDSPVILRSPTGRCQALFPFFHGHIEGEPLRYYDAHYLSDNPYRRTIYYLGSHVRVPLQDDETPSRLISPSPSAAAERLRVMLDKRKIPWQMRREDVAPWTLLHTANDFARRTLEDQIGRKYLPSCYLDRPLWSEPLRQFVSARETAFQAFLLSGSAGCGKTALLCDLTRRLLEDHPEHVVFFLRGDGILSDGILSDGLGAEGGANLLLANLLHKTGVRPADFPTFGAFFSHWAARASQDQKEDRRFVILVDALNEAGQPEQVLREALELVSAARPYPWLRIVLTARVEFLDVWRGRRDGAEASPFYPVLSSFVPPPDDPVRPRRPEDPPAWRLPDFTLAEAETVYGRYQSAQARGEAVRACRTPWPQIRPDTRRNILTVPLHIDLWMSAFDRREAPTITDSSELFTAYLDDLRARFPAFWENMARIVDYMLRLGRMELTDGEAHDLRAAWEEGRTETQRRAYSPVELACLSGVMQKRVTEEGGGYRIPFQRLREVLITRRLRDRSPLLEPGPLQEWLALPPTEELEGALAQIAEDLWVAGRSADLTLFLASEEEANVVMGSNALSRMLAHRLELHEAAETMTVRLSRFLVGVPEDEPVEFRVSSMVLFDVPSRLSGLSLTTERIGFLETVKDWMEDRLERFQDNPFWIRALSVCYDNLGDMFQSAGDSAAALGYYQKGLEIAERLHEADPRNANFARDLSVSYERLGDASRAAGDSAAALGYYQKSLEIWSRGRPAQRGLRGACATDWAMRPVPQAIARRHWATIRRLEIAERLHEADPRNANFARDLSVSYERLGDAARAAGDSAAALGYYQKSWDNLEPALRG